MTPPTPPPEPPTQQAIAAPPELPAIPRPVTPPVARVATLEPSVRFWFILSAVFMLVAVYFGLKSVGDWMSDRRLIESGTPVDAKIIIADGSNVETQRKRWDSLIVLEYNHQGLRHEVTGVLSNKTPDGFISAGNIVQLKIDPANPARWTDRQTPKNLAHALISVFVLVPVSLISGAVGWLMRARVLMSWRDGKLVPAAVLSVQGSSVAPGYVQVGALPATPKASAVRVYVKRSVALPVKGDVIWLLVPERGPAQAARAFL